jgi:hypothetical protein
MTRKDYVLLADSIADIPHLTKDVKIEIAKHMGLSLYGTNPRFDGYRFVDHVSSQIEENE